MIMLYDNALVIVQEGQPQIFLKWIKKYHFDKKKQKSNEFLI